jgi:hypothetical protein
MVLQTDFTNGPLKEFGRTFNLIKVTDTLDSMGAKTAISEASTSISGIMKMISEKDRQVREMGLAVPGNVKFFVRGDINLDEGDIIEEPSTSKRWRVETILGNRQSGTEIIFISAILKNIGLDS